MVGLFLLLLLPFSAAIYIYQKNCGVFQAKQIALGASLCTFFISSFLWICFDGSTLQYQYTPFFLSQSFAYGFPLGVDSLSLFFILLTSFTMPMCFLVGWQSVRKNIREYFIAFLLLEFFLLLVWMVTDLFLFYIFFESVLIPMFLVIGIWGSRDRKIRAAYQFFLYTLAGSVCMLLGVLFLYFQTGSTDIHLLLHSQLTEKRQLFLWLSFFASFAVKIPMIPFHLWLPEAHVEAPTAGSVLLAGILLKLGGYGFLRFSLPLFPEASLYFTPFIYTLSLCGILFSSFTTLRQIDLKKIIAYSSVAHMNYVTIGLFTWNILGVAGSTLLMISHGLVSPALFLLVGFLYDRHKTRILRYYAGCGRTMPFFALFFLFFTMANISIPGTSSFIGEFLILTSAFQINTILAIGAATGMIWGGAYALWLANRLLYGMPKVLFIKKFADLSRREFALLLPYATLTLWIGVYAQPFFSLLETGLLYHITEQYQLFGLFILSRWTWTVSKKTKTRTFFYYGQCHGPSSTCTNPNVVSSSESDDDTQKQNVFSSETESFDDYDYDYGSGSGSGFFKKKVTRLFVIRTALLHENEKQGKIIENCPIDSALFILCDLWKEKNYSFHREWHRERGIYALCLTGSKHVIETSFFQLVSSLNTTGIQYLLETKDFWYEKDARNFLCTLDLKDPYTVRHLFNKAQREHWDKYYYRPTSTFCGPAPMFSSPTDEKFFLKDSFLSDWDEEPI